jgi:surface antigen
VASINVQALLRVLFSSGFSNSDRRSSSGGTSSSSSCSSSRLSKSASRTSSRASLCGVPGSGDSNASVQSAALTHRSAQSVSTIRPLLGGSSYSLTAGSIASTISTADFRRATSGSVSATAAAPSGTRSRRVQVCTPSSPRLGRTSAM